MRLSTVVLTKDQAQRVTKGRTPLVPIEYQEAIKALASCTTFQEAKYWDDKADALAAWAKIYHSNEYVIKAKQLKLHAYRRMGQIANELRPHTGFKTGNSGAGRLPGAVALLQDNGLTKTSANAARRIALLPEKKFNKILEDPKAPATIAWKLWNTSPVWQDFTHGAMTFRRFTKTHDPKEVVALLGDKDHYAATARELCKDLTEWLDELEQRLAKVKS